MKNLVKCNKNARRLSGDWKIPEDWIMSTLIADSQFRKNDSLSVETLVDAWCISDEFAGEWKKRNLNHKPTDKQMKIVNDMCSSIRWRGRQYESANLAENEY